MTEEIMSDENKPLDYLNSKAKNSKVLVPEAITYAAMVLQEYKDSLLISVDINNSWLDHHVLNEESEIDGVIIKHHHSPETYGGVGVKTMVGNFAIIKEDQEKAVKNKGASVRVKPHKDYYGTVMILKYHTNQVNP